VEIRKNVANWQLFITLGLLLFGVVLRFVPHMPNFTPLGAIALFGGAVLGWRLAVWLPLSVLMISDIFIGVYGSIWFTWAGFFLVTLAGMGLRRANLPSRVLLGALGSSLIFFLVSNFGTWLTGGMYALTAAGLAECYFMALPFLRNSLIADLFYSTVLFGAFAAAHLYATKRHPIKNTT
jgi:hypothetical protein